MGIAHCESHSFDSLLFLALLILALLCIYSVILIPFGITKEHKKSHLLQKMTSTCLATPNSHTPDHTSPSALTSSTSMIGLGQGVTASQSLPDYKRISFSHNQIIWRRYKP